MDNAASVAAKECEGMTTEVFPFPKGTRVVQLYLSKTKGLRAQPGVVITAGPEVSEIKFDTGMIRFVTHKFLRKERPHVKTKRPSIKRSKIAP